MKGGVALEAAKKKKILLEAALALAVILAIIFVVIQLLGVGYEKIDTALALRATDSEIVGADAYVVRDEHTVYSSVAGVAEYLTADGEKLPAGTLAANIYSVSGMSASELQELLDAMDRAIRILERSNTGAGASYSDVKAMSEEIDTLFYDVVHFARSGGNAQMANMLDELLVLMGRYRLAIGTGEDLSGKILELRSRKTELLTTYGTRAQGVTADKSGYFYRGTDGYEGLLTPELLDALTYEEFTAASGADASKNPYAVGKIVSGYNWYIVIEVSQSVADKFSEQDGFTYPVTFTENSDRVIEMELYRKISHSGGALIVLMSDVMPTDFDYTRVQNVTVTLSEHSGYRVPSEAIAEREGEIGVYTVDSNQEVHFKKVKTLYVSDAYTIVAENDGSEEMAEYLKLNDVMIISGKDIYDGKIIG